MDPYADVIRAKLIVPPLRQTHVLRPALLAQLNNGLDLGYKFTLLVAPAGFGKTTLVSEWVSSGTRPTAWVSLDPGDNNAVRFWRHVAAGIQQQVAGVDFDSRLGQLYNTTAITDAIVPQLVNGLLDTNTPLFLVLDDYHVIENSAIHASVCEFISYLPRHVHLIITTRIAPPDALCLPLHRGRLEVNEIRGGQLCFNLQEAGQYLNQSMSLGLTPVQVETLLERTEGWITGVQLAALALRHEADKDQWLASFSGDNAYVSEYLLTEVFSASRPETRRFLLQISILPQFDAELCDAVVDDVDSDLVLERLSSEGVLIQQLDTRHQLYRFHSLFGDLLRRVVKKTEPDLFLKCNRRASLWYERQGFIDEAISYALAGGESDRAARILQTRVDSTFIQGGYRQVAHWLKQLPDDTLWQFPKLVLAKTWVHWLSQDTASADLVLKQIEQITAVVPGHALLIQNRLRGEYRVLQSLVTAYYGDFSGSAGFAREAILACAEYPAMDGLARYSLASALLNLGEIEEAVATFERACQVFSQIGHLQGEIESTIALARIYSQQGALTRAQEICVRALTHLENTANAHFYLWALYFGLIEVLYERDQVIEAEDLLARVNASYKYLTPEGQYLRLLWTAAIKRAKRQEAPEAVLEAVREITVKNVNAFTANRLYSQLAHWSIVAGQPEPGRASLAQVILPDTVLLAPNAMIYVTRARLAYAFGRYPDAERQLDRIEKAIRAKTLVGSVFQIRLLRALVYQAQGKHRRAASEMREALKSSKACGYVRSILDYGEPAVTLLRACRAVGIEDEYVDDLLRRAATSQTDAEVTSASPLRVTLSERELNVLRLLGTGHSYREIGERLYVSINTVRTHVGSIYRKLGVHSRDQALVKARGLGLI